MNRKRYDANPVAKALLRDLASRAEISPELAHIDLIFVAGDIAFAGCPEGYRLAEKFFKDLLKATEVDKGRLSVVPGNHDVNRTAISSEACDIVSKLGKRIAVNSFLESDLDRTIVMQRFCHYQQFVNDYLGGHLAFDNVRYFCVKRRKVGDKWVEILGLNSAWASASDADQLNLFLGERQVRAALNRTKRSDIRIALMHHPFEWLRDFDRDDCEPLLLSECDFVLHGHLLRTGLMRFQYPVGEAIVFSAGACHKSRKHPNTYNLVHLDLDSGKSKVYLRTYSDQQSGFWTQDSMTYRGIQGKYTFELPQRKGIDVEAFPLLCTNANKH